MMDNHDRDDTADHAARDPDHDENTPHARLTATMKQDHDQLHQREADTGDRQEALVDEGLEETFPASDPVSAKRIT